MRYISIEEVLVIHDMMLEVAGGREGVRDFALLHSALERPRAGFGGEEMYETVWLKVGALIQSLVKNHPFSDGNKRTPLFCGLRGEWVLRSIFGIWMWFGDCWNKCG